MQHMNLQRTKALAERDVLFRGDPLVTEHEHMVIQVRAMDAGEIVG